MALSRRLGPLETTIAATAAGHPILEADTDRFRAYRDWDGHGYGTCWWSALQTCITPNGSVWTCVNKREHSGAKVGDLSRESFADIWARRPGSGEIAGYDFDKVVGKRLTRAVTRNTQLKWSDLT